MYYHTKSEDDVIWFSNIYYLDYICFSIFFITPIQKHLAPMIIGAASLMFLGKPFIAI
jgi:hypothetical protein